MIHRLASTENREKILEYIVSVEEFGIDDVAKAVGVSKGLVSLYLKELIDLGFVKKQGRRFYLVPSPELRETKRFLNFWILREKFLPFKYNWIKALGVHGSFARGENRKDSDVDVWILVDKKDPVKVMELIENLEKALGREVDLLVLTREKLARMKEENPYLHWSIKFSSLVLWGDIDGL